MNINKFIISCQKEIKRNLPEPVIICISFLQSYYKIQIKFLLLKNSLNKKIVINENSIEKHLFRSISMSNSI